MNKKQKVILVFAIISFICVLFNFLAGNMRGLLISFCISAVLLILFIFMADEKEEREDLLLEDANLRISDLKEENEKLKASLSNTSASLMKAQKEAQDAKEEAAEAKIKAQKAKKATIEAINESAEYKDDVKRKAQYDISTLLPHIYSNEADEKKIDIIKIAKDTIQELKEFGQNVGIDIRLNTQLEKLYMTGNDTRIGIMLRNVIDNSIKYMKRKGTLIVTISKFDDRAFIVLKDDGEGLPKDELAHIFDLNFQGTNRISGNGLGLAQSKAIVSHYKGSIYAKSDVGVGMGIYIELPCNAEGEE